MIWGVRKFKPLFPEVLLQGHRIYMRPPMMEDCEAWIRVRGRNADHLRPFDPRWPKDALTRELFTRRINRQAREWEAGQANALLIFKNEDDRLIGGMNVNNICRGAAQYGALGYWIDKDHEGQGYMAESLDMTLQYCFYALNLHRVNASCLPHNERSKKTLLKAGFKEEGFAEKYLEIDGLWQDHTLFGLPVENWKKP